MAQVTVIRTAAEEALSGALHRLNEADATKEGRSASGKVGALKALARSEFNAHGLPHRRLEAWKYTDLRALQRDMKPLAGHPSGQDVATITASLAGDAPRGIRIVLIDGSFQAALSDVDALPAGVTVTSLASAIAKGRKDVVERLCTPSLAARDPAFNLNTAFLHDGVVIDIAAGVQLDRPLLVLQCRTDSADKAVFARSLVTLGAGAQASLIEEERGSRADQINGVLDIVVGDGAQLAHRRIQNVAGTALSLTTMKAELGAKAAFESFALNSGGQVTRNQLFVTFLGADSRALLAGLSLLNGKQHADTTLVVDHAAPGCESRELFKHVLDEEAHGVFQGKIIVAPEAQKTDGRMMSRAVMLTEGPAMDNKPELEIFADDVACAHGCTCGQLDEELLFYLQARGIPPKEAEALMVQAFAGESIEAIGSCVPTPDAEDARLALFDDLATWVAARGTR